ncbi:MAG: tRNA pseudouridine(55) synthase TruB [Zoogloea sp.]|nr:tRNA pseudouridine(55) synthase TruB [Zoogloea sp.]
MKPRIPRRPVDGVLLLDKPGGITSNTALQIARRLYNAAKAGHTGTLDPMATGLLPLTFGEATKFSQMLLEADKTYEATLRLGITTATADAEGEVLLERPVTVGEAEVLAALPAFRGEIEQVPPMYSALKHQGKALYEYAREGVEIERKSRRVTIRRLDCIEVDGPLVRISVDCSKGTYIRTLAADIGEALGCGAHLVALRRTRIGVFSVGQAVSLAELEAMELVQRDARLAPVDALVQHLPQHELDAEGERNFTHGQAAAGPEDEAGKSYRVYCGGRFLGLGTIVPGARIAPARLLATAAAT